MSMNTDTQIDPQLVINDLLDQIKRLTLDNSMLRAYINSAAVADQPDETVAAATGSAAGRNVSWEE